MGRKRQGKDQAHKHAEAAADRKAAAGHAAEDAAGPGRRSRRGRKLALLLALAGTATYLVRRNQRRAELDEGIWHEAPTPASPVTTAPTA